MTQKLAKPNQVSPENQLLLCCARTQISPKVRGRIRALVQQQLDWQYLLQTADRHKVNCLLYCQLKAICPEAVPKNVQAILRRAFSQNTKNNLCLTKELFKLLALFKTASIPILAFKGPTLAQLAYGKLNLRQFIDLDFLVKPEGVAEVNQLLIDRGYQPRFDLTKAQETILLNFNHQRAFQDPTKGINVDVHWSIISQKFSFSPEEQIFWDNYHQVRLANNLVDTISPDNLLLFLCAHGAKHNWSQLNWISDLAALLNKYSPDWNYLSDRAGKCGSKTMFWLGVYLANLLLDAELPSQIVRQIEDFPQVYSLAERVQQQLFSRRSYPIPLFNNTIYLGTMESRRDKLVYCLDYLITPTLYEFSLLSLPQWLAILYYPIRLLRLAFKYSLLPLLKLLRRQ